jgi:hypothetical protein
MPQCQLYNMLAAPVMPPALCARMHDVSRRGLLVQPRVDGAVAGADALAASQVAVGEAVECLVPRTYADGHDYNAGPMRSGDAAHGGLSEGSHSPDIPAAACR